MSFALLTACGKKEDEKDSKPKRTSGGISLADLKTAKGELQFDKYRITPPENYVYIPEDYEKSIKKIDRLFIRFFEDRGEAGKLGTKDNKLVLTFGLFPKRFNQIDSYYKGKKGSSKLFDKIPKKYNLVRNNGQWNCRYFDRKYNPALSCAILGDKRLIKIDAVGGDMQEILGKIDLIEDMLESFYIFDTKAAEEKAAKEAADREVEEKAAKEAADKEAEEALANEESEGQNFESSEDISEDSSNLSNDEQ